jgi:hypothetical protein
VVEAELGGNHHLAADRGKGFAHELFVDKRAVGLGGIEKGDATIHGSSNHGDHLLPVCCRTIVGAHAHASEPDCRDFQIAISKLALLHLLLLRFGINVNAPAA